jgi:predicted membrane channel-forming protein YqfA (hemolysin III family)
MDSFFLITVFSVVVCLVLAGLFGVTIKKRVKDQATFLSVVNYILLGLFLPVLIIHLSLIFFDLLKKPIPLILVWMELILFPFYLSALCFHVWLNKKYFSKEDY